MIKGVLVGSLAVVTGLFLIGAISSDNEQSTSSNLNAIQSVNARPAVKVATPTCDGATVTTSCVVDGVAYTTYIYHPAVPEKSHTETVTTYKQEVTGYCTLCVDGTYSPTCATGRGACSHHGGVAQWNAPRYASVPVYSARSVIDAVAQEAYYEKNAQ